MPGFPPFRPSESAEVDARMTNKQVLKISFPGLTGQYRFYKLKYERY